MELPHPARGFIIFSGLVAPEVALSNLASSLLNAGSGLMKGVVGGSGERCGEWKDGRRSRSESGPLEWSLDRQCRYPPLRLRSGQALRKVREGMGHPSVLNGTGRSKPGPAA